MKLLEFKRVEDKEDKYGIDPDGEWDWFVWLEDENEEAKYDEYFKWNKNGSGSIDYAGWREYMSSSLGQRIEDDDIFYYFSPEDEVPAIGETFELDDMVWERTK